MKEPKAKTLYAVDVVLQMDAPATFTAGTTFNDHGRTTVTVRAANADNAAGASTESLSKRLGVSETTVARYSRILRVSPA